MSVDSTALERSALERKDREELTTIAQALGGKPTSRTRKADIVAMILDLTGVEPAAEAPAETSPSASSPAGRGGRRRRAEVNGDGDEPAAGTSDGADTAAPASDVTEVSEDEPPAEWELAVASEDPEGGDPSASGSSGRSEEASSGADRDREAAGGTAEPAKAEVPAKAGDAADASEADAAGDRGGRGSDRAERERSDNRSDREPRRDDGGQRGQGRQDQSGRQQDRGDQQQGRSDQQQGRSDQQQGRSDQQQGRSEQQQGKQGGDNEPEAGNRRRRRRGRNRDRDRGGEQAPQAEEWNGEPVEVEGFLDLRDEGYGFLRVKGYLPSKDDVYVSVKQARQFNLRKGDHLKGASRPAQRNEKNPALLRIDAVNGQQPEALKGRKRFEDLTPLFPDEKLKMELADDPTNMTARIIDLISPIGKGQRGLIVSPPKAGKTTVMKQIARSIEVNNPEVHLFVLLVDERPEEVTDMRRWLLRDTSTVVASTFDRPSDEHTQVAELAIERAKRLVEEGKDVVIILDGITRLARAYNLAAPATGRIMSGGIDTGALYPPKKFFGAARNVEEGGSLTILATALVETGSRMDEVIFEEFKGTGNMELRLDRRLAERRVYPAIDVDASSTRHEELLFPRNQLNMVWKLRRVLSGLAGESGTGAGLELLIDRMKTFKSNDEFLAEVAKAPMG